MEKSTSYQSIKGISYVTITAVLLFLLVNKFYSNLSEKIEQLELLNKKLNQQSRKLENSNRDLEQMVYVASHDLQEPLRMVSSFMGQLQQKHNEELDQKGRRYIKFALDGAERMKRIILDLLDFAEAVNIEESTVTINLNELMEKVVASHQRTIHEKKAVITWENMPEIKGKKIQLIQVFQNLLSNALTYHKEDTIPKIHIGFENKSDTYQFSIKDNGIGINPKYQEQIFNIFKRLHTQDEFQGTGMGLAISKKIILNLDGKIWVNSSEGNGSTFYFTLPKSKNSPQ
ncbi:sensor histidine kinase [Belliella baltica]|uniref:sensor histidine kinase n=1 Tax=Belliella baltica TaxID=232259 RepID=UPI00145C7F53|nr:ATP-binding protein [Belliella baltica]